MEINSLPTETLSFIIGHLIGATRYDLEDPKLADICQARLVCRKWDQVARQHIFRDIALAGTSNDLKTWNKMLDNAMIRDIARRVDIHSISRNGESWGTWIDGIGDAMRNSIARIAELKRVNSLVLRFSRYCWGEETGPWGLGYAQTIDEREVYLLTVLKAIVDRAREGDVCPIRSLTIDNLQNIPIPEIIASELFKEATKDIEQLNLIITFEKSHSVEMYDFIERRTFEPFLQNVMLPTFADRLTSLSLVLKQYEGWGVVPITFDGQGLVFPHLKKAILGSFLIAHHNQLDWLLSSTLLESLRLTDCHIGNYISVSKEGAKKYMYNIPMHDWVKHPKGTFGVKPPAIPYTFPGTWAHFLDKIRTSLPHLVDFCLNTADAYPFVPRWQNRMTKDRYFCIKIGERLSVSEMMLFGANNKLIGRTHELEINPAGDHLKDDTRALEELNMAIMERRRRL